jgi:hypothetical protein
MDELSERYLEDFAMGQTFGSGWPSASGSTTRSPHMSILSGKTALVTGASRWNGRTSAVAFVPRFSNRPVRRS